MSSAHGSPTGPLDGDAASAEPIDDLVEQFLRQHRSDASTTVDAFVAAHPQHAALLREVLPTLVALERVKRERASTGSHGLSPRALPPIERLGDFKIVREIGRGGMGVVFEAMQESLQRRVALKVLPQASLLSGNQLERFRREAQIASQLHHTNIVPVFGSGETDGFHWYAMQFIAGDSLDRWRQARAAAPPTDGAAWRDHARFVARIGVQAAGGLHYAHTQGTLHRDIKPGNLLIERDEHVWVTDFGLAKALEAEGLTNTGDLLGTLQYMAPEQFAGHYDVRSEVYALGITLYELLVLRPAFAAKTRTELMERIRTRPPLALRQSTPDVPEDLAVVVERALSRDPNDRYPDAAALAADLEAFLADRPIAARRHTRAQIVWRWCRQNRAFAALAACTVIAILGAAVTGWMAYGVATTLTAQVLQESRAKEKNLALMRETFAAIFDNLVGRDPGLAIDEDPDTGEQALVTRTVDPRDMVLLQTLLAHYDRFAAENEVDESLRVETARAYRRVGLIQTRLGSLDEGQAAYEKALQRYRGITGRDVSRELADLHVAYGQLERLRGKRPEAEQRFRLALELLGPDHDTDARGLRFQRAEVLFLSASGPPGPAESEAGRRGPADRNRDGERPRDPARNRSDNRADPRRDLTKPREILTSLLQQEPANPDFLALQGRCLLAAGRQRGGPPDAEREEDRLAGIELFRQLVREHPANDQFATELCAALLDGRHGSVRGARSEAQAAVDLARLEEAKRLAEDLLARQPQFTEYQVLRAQVGSSLGRLLLRAPADEATRARRRTEAEAELRLSLQLVQALLERGAGAEGMLRRDLRRDAIAARVALAVLLADGGKLEDAATEAASVVVALRAIEPRSGRPAPIAFNAQLFDELDSVLRRAKRTEFAKELEDLRQRLLDDHGPPPSSRRPR